MPLFGKTAKVAPAPPDAIEKKYIIAAIDQLVKEGKSWKGSDGEEVVDGDVMMALAKKLQDEGKVKTWKGGRRRRTRRRSRPARGLGLSTEST